ncbi:MAG: TAT-variant-translocated molybdopterin oxidoreductase, partial [Balneola sp.]
MKRYYRFGKVSQSKTKNFKHLLSLNELAKNQEYQKFVEREFPENASELSDGFSRRGFLAIMGSAVLLASCDFARRPVQKILPYSKQPEDIVPGVPLFYASAMPFQGSLTGLVVENHEGRPTKVEGNDMHPGSRGGTSIFHQASVLGMYDPDRSKKVLRKGTDSTVNDFVDFAKKHFADTSKNIAFISEASSSPTLSGLKAQALNKFNNADWVTYEPFGESNALEGTQKAFGRRLRAHFDFSKANVF